MQKSTSRISEQTWLILLMVISVLTMAVHLYLTLQHYQLKLGLAESPAVCNVSSTFNCDTVSISRYATLFGIPMALLGLITQVIFFTFLISARFSLSSADSSIRRLLFWISLFVAGVSLVMGSFSAFALGTYCLFCMAAYGLSVLQLVASWKLQGTPLLSRLGSDFGIFIKQSRWVPILLILIPVFAKISHSIVLDSYGFGKLEMIVQDAVSYWESSPVVNFKPETGLQLPARSGEAKMTIVEFADFLCPHCKSAFPTLDAFAQSHPDIQLTYKAFPLDKKCNKDIQREGDGLTCRLTSAVFCAESMNQKGWAAHHWVFERQETFFRGAGDWVSQISQDLQLDKQALETCMNSDATHESLQSMAQEGVDAKIQGTPTIYVNGKLLQRGQFLPILEAIYKKLNP